MLKINKFAQATSVAALTVGVVFAAQPAQKASAQTFTGAGASSVTTLLKDNTAASGSSVVWQYANANGTPYNYYVTGSGTGRSALQNGSVDFAFADALGTTFGANAVVRNNTLVNSVNNQVVLDPNTNLPYVVVNEATLNVVFPFNVSGFNGGLTRTQACGIIGGTITNWNQVGGPNSTIRRVIRADASGTSVTIQNSFIGPICGLTLFDANGNFTGTRLSTDIFVNPPANPLGSTDHSNPGSYSLGVANTVKNTPGAVGYVESVIANNAGLPLLRDLNNNGQTTIAAGPTYGLFRAQYGGNFNAAAQNVCEGAVFGVFEGNRGNYPNEAGFNINTAGFASPYLIPGSAEQGTDTDNYGSYVSVIIGNNYFDVGPCARIGAPGLNLLTFSGTRSGSSITVSTQPTIFPGQSAPRTRLQYGDTVEVTDASGNITYGTVVSPTSGQVAPGGTVQLSVWQDSNRNEINVLNGNRNLTLTVNYQ